MATTFKQGDPSFAGPLGGISLNLPSYHIFELKELIDQLTWEKNMTLYELEIEDETKEEILQTMRAIRQG